MSRRLDLCYPKRSLIGRPVIRVNVKNMMVMKRLLPSLLAVVLVGNAAAQTVGLDPSIPFYAASTLPFQAPPFDKIKDSDYQPAIEAGIGEESKEIEAIANNPSPPDFANTILLSKRVASCFRVCSGLSML
jgi:peptidyl-dipeptidase Dcp